jgi:hypothetical protein
VAAGGCCNDFEPVKKEKSMKAKKFRKFIPFAKVDAAKREVWGIVTAEVPDKDDEVCDYETTKPLYQAVIDEMTKATDGQNFFPLRAMHQLIAAGKCIGFDFRDSDREIFMGFKVVDDDEWKKVDEGVYTGFSHGGSVVKMWEDPVYKDCQRYTAEPSEISLVDNPCLGIAHFSYVKTDGTIELRKLKGAAMIDERSELLKSLQAENEELKRELLKDAKTKRVAGEDLTASSFLIVGDESDPASWKLPIKFSNEKKTVSHLRNALSRFGQVKDVPQAKKDAAWKKLVILCEKHDIDVTEEKAKLATIQSWLRKEIRIKVHKISRKVRGGNVGYALAVVDFDLGKLAKGLCEVSRLAQLVEELGWLCYAVVCEQDWEGDAESPLPEMMASNVETMLDTLLSMVEEESQEMKDNLAERIAGAGQV